MLWEIILIIAVFLGLGYATVGTLWPHVIIGHWMQGSPRDGDSLDAELRRLIPELYDHNIWRALRYAEVLYKNDLYFRLDKQNWIAETFARRTGMQHEAWQAIIDAIGRERGIVRAEQQARAHTQAQYDGKPPQSPIRSISPHHIRRDPRRAQEMGSY